MISWPTATSPISRTYSRRTINVMQQWLQVDPSEGLKDDVEKRRTIYGRNAFDAKPPTSFFAFWWDAMHDGAIIVL